jgi:hypothetical protein
VVVGVGGRRGGASETETVEGVVCVRFERVCGLVVVVVVVVVRIMVGGVVVVGHSCGLLRLNLVTGAITCSSWGLLARGGCFVCLIFRAVC